MKTILIKPFFFIAYFVFAIIAVISCNSGDQKSSSKNDEQEKKVVYLVLKSLGNPFFKDIQTGVESAIGNNISLHVRSGKDESDISGQDQILKAILNVSNREKISGIILTPSSSGEHLIASIKQLVDKGIPIVLVDTKIDSVILAQNGIKPLPYIASSNIEGGKQAAEYLVNDLTDKQTSILILGGVESQETAIQRKSGFESFLKSQPIQYNIEYREAKWNRTEAQTIVASFYSAGRRFDAIFGANDEMALGALQASLNKSVQPMPIIVGFDAIDEVLKSSINATIAQNPKVMGGKSVEVLNAIWNGGPYQIANLIPTQLIVIQE